MTNDDRGYAQTFIHTSEDVENPAWDEGVRRLIRALADARKKRVPPIGPTDDRDYARGIIRTARKAMRDGDGGYGLLYLLVEALSDALETEIETSNTLRQTVKAYLAADKFRD